MSTENSAPAVRQSTFDYKFGDGTTWVMSLGADPTPGANQRLAGKLLYQINPDGTKIEAKDIKHSTDPATSKATIGGITGWSAPCENC